MAVQKAQADVLINRLHYALPGWDGAEGRRDAQEGSYESAQAREFAVWGSRMTVPAKQGFVSVRAEVRVTQRALCVAGTEMREPQS
jgi:hypothetical protein